MKAMVTTCDLNTIDYDEPVEGAHVIVRGATGRWCCVMWAGPEYLDENNIKTITRGEVEDFIIECDGEHAIDF